MHQVAKVLEFQLQHQFFVLFCFCLENRTTLFATLTAALPGAVAVVYVECPEWGTRIASISPGEAGRCGLGAAEGMAEGLWGPVEAQRPASALMR